MKPPPNLLSSKRIKNCLCTLGRTYIKYLPFVLFHAHGVVAQAIPKEDLNTLARTEACLIAFKNDSAMLLAGNLLERLKKQEEENSRFGIRVQLAEAIAFEQDQRGDEAIARLLHVMALSKHNNLWNIYAKACINLALVYEKVALKKNSLEYLQEAKSCINRYQLDSIYPHFALRMASWHRIFGQRDSALYYATQTIQTASKLNQYLQEATGHMLMNMLLPASAVEARLQHCRAGLNLYKKIKDSAGCSYMYGAIARIYFQNNDLQQALRFNDSTLISANRTILEGNTQFPALASSYRFRGEIYKAWGQWDSAWVYMLKGYEHELALNEKNINDKIVEVDARYNNEKKQQQIDAQKLELTLKNKQLAYTLVIFALVLLLAAGLMVGFYRQRKSRRKLAAQNAIIEAQSEQLKLLDAAKSRFFANVSHELRTPLTLLTSPIQRLLKENQLTEQQTQLLQMAERSGNQLGQLINEMLDLRKIEMGKMTVTAEPTELRSYFQTYFAQFESLAAQKQIDYKVVFDMPEKATADLDREKCRQILFNLLSNAFKFTPQGGSIEARVQAGGHQMQLSISDSGSGIHPDDLPYIFDRYFQSNRPEKPAEGGTGIGLALCREYVQLFGGTVHAESTPGHGAVFRVAFPLKMAESEAAAFILPVSSKGSKAPDETESVPPLSGVASGLSVQSPILVVEDNPDLREYIRFILHDKYHVVTAENGQAALEFIRNARPDGMSTRMERSGVENKSMTHKSARGNNFISHPSSAIIPQLILSDLMMPVMDGYQLLQRLKSDDATRHIPVVMLTARAEAQDKLRALRIGVDDYLTKPFDEAELLVRIENLLKNQAARRLTMAEDIHSAEPVDPSMSQPDREWLETFEAYIQKHFAGNTLTVSGLAHTFVMSESTLLRQLKRLTGLSPLQYIQEVRLNEARRLLENRACNSIAQVASKVGYDDAWSFARAFRQRFGKLPSEIMGI